MIIIHMIDGHYEDHVRGREIHWKSELGMPKHVV